MLHQLVKWDFGMQRGEWENVFGSSNLYQAAPLDEVESDAKTQQPGPGVGAISCSLIWICSPFVVCTPDLMQKTRARARTHQKKKSFGYAGSLRLRIDVLRLRLYSFLKKISYFTCLLFESTCIHPTFISLTGKRDPAMLSLTQTRIQSPHKNQRENNPHTGSQTTRTGINDSRKDYKCLSVQSKMVKLVEPQNFT